jgi:hypothetical protein
MHGAWPHPAGLAVLTAYSVAFTAAATRFFRWD